ncbi:MAG TPA: alpha/beta hydrolase [Bryobacteraceae bacterium]|jgi:pimeloyl-ACP methyl ester carboxylesterase
MRRAVVAILMSFAGAVVAQGGDPPPPIGKLVDVGGYRVHMHCTGEGSPTVFVIGGYSVDWDLVQPQVAKFTRICTYDVSGTAWSDGFHNHPGAALTCVDRVDEIHRLLNAAAIPGPYVFVGFSVGGLISRSYASKYPAEVSGVVFVDHAFTPRPPPRAAAPADSSRPVVIFQTPITFTAEDTSNFSNLPERIRELHRWAAAREPEIDQSITADDCEAELGKSTVKFSLADMPLAVVSTGNEARGYKELQAELLALSHNSRQLMATHSFHSVEIDQPEVVIEAIRDVVDRVRRK